MNEELVNYINQRQKELNLTKIQLASKIGITRQALHKTLVGDVKKISLSTIIGLARALKVHPIALLQKLFVHWEFPPVETKGALHPNDATGFIGDINYPDNTQVKTGQVFAKIWRSQNLGKHAWQNCTLKCFDAALEVSTGDSEIALIAKQRALIPTHRRIKIPKVEPGETVDLAVEFKAPDYPCTTISYWKMVDQQDRILFS